MILSDFLDYLSVVKGMSKATLKEYRLDIINFFRFIIKRKKLSILESEVNVDVIKGIDLMDMYAYMNFIKNERLNGAYARGRKTASLKTFYKFLTDKAKVIDKNIALELESPKTPKRNPIYLNLDEAKRMLNAIDTDYKYFYRDYCIVSIFLQCALRLSELCSINIKDIDFSEMSLRVVGKGDKERMVYLNDSVGNSIKRWLEDRNKYRIKEGHEDALFISNHRTRITPRGVQNIVKKYANALGLDKNITPHKLRHTSATLMFKYGKIDIRTIQRVLGHESIATTQIYTHVDDEGIKTAFKSNPLSSE